jgi:hypothetical protein
MIPEVAFHLQMGTGYKERGNLLEVAQLVVK